ncbi:DUF6880 family protein [Actinokineospora inagensis]|uniref:DUF6880 family protein n=1 Tax=Actinokineospora inagensis TaxID=103730 RepID=UPI00047EB884|nr:DUF6880 family protein [Actinokineospora inagensis]
MGEPRPKPLSDRRLRSFLRGCDQEWLIEQLMTAAKSDRALWARLAIAAGQENAFDDRDIRDRLERAIDIPDFVDYGGAYGYFLHVGEALDEVERLVGAGFADAAITLAEYALELLESSAERVDDSDGGLSEAIARLEEIHLAACEAGSPDPVELAERLVTRAVSSDYEVFLDVLPAYEEVLGSAGLAQYRQLVEQGWRKLPPKKPNDYGARRFVITHLMENLAESSGGTDGLIEVLARDLTSTYDVLRIAERLCADGRDDEALTWLERGLADFDLTSACAIWLPRSTYAPAGVTWRARCCGPTSPTARAWRPSARCAMPPPKAFRSGGNARSPGSPTHHQPRDPGRQGARRWWRSCSPTTRSMPPGRRLSTAVLGRSVAPPRAHPCREPPGRRHPDPPPRRRPGDRAPQP